MVCCASSGILKHYHLYYIRKAKIVKINAIKHLILFCGSIKCKKKNLKRDIINKNFYNCVTKKTDRTMGFIDQIGEIISNLFGFVKPIYLIVYLVLVAGAVALAFTKKISNNLASTIAILPLGIYLLLFMVMGVKIPIDEQAEIDAIEKRIISKLTLIRDIQEEMFKQKSMYARTPEALIDFFKNGKIPITEKKEKDLGNDSVLVTIDTLQIVSAKELMASNIKAAKSKAKSQRNIDHLNRMMGFVNDIDNIAIVPSNGDQRNKFDWFADTIRKGGVLVHVFEIKDVSPVNPKRGGIFDPAKRELISTRMKKLNEKKKTLDDNVRFVESKRKPILKSSRDIRKKMKALEEEGKTNGTQYEALVAKFQPFKEELAPWDAKLSNYKTILKDVEDKLTILKEKPLKVGARDEPSTAGNWQ